MARRFDLALRLEAVHSPDDVRVATDSVRAHTADPVWFLARQWQLGEHRGADIASPVRVEVSFGETPITHARPGPEFDPRITPPECVVESEPGQWWTIGRRVRVGQALAAMLPIDHMADRNLGLTGLAAPYDRLNGRGLDGRLLYQNRGELGLTDVQFVALGVPVDEPDDDWNPTELTYDAVFGAGATTLTLPRHDGGDVDWYSAAASGPPPSSSPRAPSTFSVIPSRVRYPGSPSPRWWQIDDHRVDPGAVAPHRTDLVALLMIHVTSSHADGWFTAPIPVASGSVVATRSVDVVDSMGMSSPAMPVTGWSMFEVTGLGPNALLVWPTAAGGIRSATALDDIVVGIDEDANVLWAVEQRVGGADVETYQRLGETTNDNEPTSGQVAVTGRRRYRYVPATNVPPFWHPYLIAEVDGHRRFVQGRLADLGVRPTATRAGPTSSLLIDPAASSTDPFHAIDPAVVPERGLRLQRRYRLGRRTDGLPVLWLERRRLPLSGLPVSGLRFDVLDEQTPVVNEQP